MKIEFVFRKNRWAKLALLFALAFLSVKGAFVDPSFASHGDCQEFGHIHLYQTHSADGFAVGLDSIKAQDLNSSEKSCHEGKIFLDTSPFPFAKVFFIPDAYRLVYKLVFNWAKFLEEPELEPLRKPPKSEIKFA